MKVPYRSNAETMFISKRDNVRGVSSPCHHNTMGVLYGTLAAFPRRDYVLGTVCTPCAGAPEADNYEPHIIIIIYHYVRARSTPGGESTY